MHLNWAFEAASTYKIQMQATATLAGTGEQISSDIVTYTFKVVN
ncbi:TIGR03769 domain-containing protein [Micromonospora craniellae]|uniref:Uncharacterized protein n=1 Tax=Micromonospora craniellae TaxID=2294034 RepID=A0A372FYL9_9ACTN|nr:TIGR03769 domain-containing protein [Micromonospora craniellae]RFS45590.1 hypothetical protein D0Q02_15960 [Micromonospora craniellae]